MKLKQYSHIRRYCKLLKRTIILMVVIGLYIMLRSPTLDAEDLDLKSWNDKRFKFNEDRNDQRLEQLGDSKSIYEKGGDGDVIHRTGSKQNENKDNGDDFHFEDNNQDIRKRKYRHSKDGDIQKLKYKSENSGVINHERPHVNEKADQIDRQMNENIHNMEIKGKIIEHRVDNDKNPIAAVLNQEVNKPWNMVIHRENAGKPEVTFPPFVEHAPEDGPGEYGLPYKPSLNASEKAKMRRMFNIHYFNVYISDKIAVHRRLSDTRATQCKTQQFHKNLPTTSVIICFHNEAWSALLRSVHSVLDRTPDVLLREIILVDDGSSFEYLKEPLDLYMSKYPKVKILRKKEDEGITRARLLGYRHAEGDVLVFLDSHIECFPGWLEPLLDRIVDNPHIVPFPHIAYINSDNFGAVTSMYNMAGSFTWKQLLFKWINVPEEEKQRRHSDIDPLRSATMPGGLFAIDKNYFTTLGAYDPELMFWGSENMELSFKVWMCNGSIELIPCSQVGHIFRSQNPNTWHSDVSIIVRRNSKRVAEVWMDEYKDVFYDENFYKNEDIGDISERLRLRKSLHCRSFKWYIENVAHVSVPLKSIARGEIRNAIKPVCLDSMGLSRRLGLYQCHGTGQNQYWMLKENGLLQQPGSLVCSVDGQFTLLNKCPHPTSWRYHTTNRTLVHRQTSLCLQMKTDLTLGLARCSGSNWQQWIVPLIDVMGAHDNNGLSQS